MPFNRNPPDEAEIRALFVDLPPVPPRTFEFALVLGGTVSAGAYTAGAIDFLIQALDDFSLARSQGLAPQHNVTLRLIAGTSGGGVNAAIAARALAYDYPHITTLPAAAELNSANPFFNVWVNTLTLDRLLATGDDDGPLTALLNPEPIDASAAQIVGYSADAKSRDWLANPLDIITTMTNLRGMPYRTDLGGGLGQSFVDHADHARFAVRYPQQPATPARPDTFPLDFAAGGAQAWDAFSQFARATAAFPIGFPARALARPMAHYRYRVLMAPTGPGGAMQPAAHVPDWAAIQPPDEADVPAIMEFLSVDGGATNNQPLELARVAMAGLGKTNPRDGTSANRAVWLIDPFASKARLGPQDDVGLLEAAGALLGTMIEQTRYSTADLMLAMNDGVFSRFMLTPHRVAATGLTAIGADAIASAGLGAFIGFACRDFTRHDYLLGRANCRDFLRTQFSLQRDNPVLSGWTDKQKDHHQIAGTDEVPLIPLFGQSAAPAPLDPWPTGRLDPVRYRKGVEARYRALVDRAVGGSFIAEVLGDAAAAATDQLASGFVIKKMRAALAETGLT